MKNFKCILIVLTVFLFSCKKENRCDCIKRTGEIITETRTLPVFSKLYVEQDVNVFITQDSIEEVKVEAGKNIAPLIQTVVDGGTLEIRNENKCNWAREYGKPLNVYIKTPGFRYIKLNGTGNIKSLNTITKDTFDIQIENSGNIELTVNSSQVVSHIYGVGDLTLHGKTVEHSCSIGGSSYLYCADLTSSYTWVQSYTLGLCYVNTSGLLISRIDNQGDIYCYGHPTTVQKTFNGTGQLHIE